MNNKIPFSDLCAMVATAAGTSKKVTEEFLREFFNEITSCLENGETVKIKGIGTFKVSRVNSRKSINVSSGEEIEIPQHVKTVFVPTKELAQAVNLPFEAFEAIEIGDSVTSEMLQQSEEDEINIASETPATEETKTNETSLQDSESKSVETNNDNSDSEPFYYMKITDSSESADEEKPEEQETKQEETKEEESHQELPEQEEATEEILEEPIAIDPVEETEIIDSTPIEADVETPQKNNNVKGFIIGFISAFAIVAAAAAIIFFCFPGLFKSVAPTDNKEAIAVIKTEEPATINNDSTEIISSDAEQKVGLTPPTPASDETVAESKPKTDTITKTRYLTTMARDHYGNYNLWPYIYKENENILGHPDRIRPGTEVVIPDLKKYGIDPSNPDDIKKAKRLGVEIYARYKK
jgi:nucleoid DNA-binding protein